MRDSHYYNQTIRVLAGTDEAGRGPWAGPVVAAAVILPPDIRMPGLNDSKQLTESKREELFPLIQRKALCYGIAEASVEEIETLNIREASFLAMKRALEQLTMEPDLILVDGFPIPYYPLPTKGIVKGDRLLRCIAAASILAKVSRDRMMHELHQRYPDYRFDKHKGYGTALHQQQLLKHGVSPVHRKTFAPIKALLLQ